MADDVVLDGRGEDDDVVNEDVLLLPALLELEDRRVDVADNDVVLDVLRDDDDVVDEDLAELDDAAPEQLP